MSQLNFDTQLSFDELNKNEWLETNGLGGWASASLTGCNTRRYHGLLVAAVQSPEQRMVLVSKLDETIIAGSRRIDLGTNDYGNAVAPQGYRHLKSFSKNLYPEFVYEAEGFQLRKSIVMQHGANTTILKYEVLKAGSPFTLQLLPLLAVRHYHKLTQANDKANKSAIFENGQFKINMYEGTPDIFIRVSEGQYQHNPAWYFKFNYSEEKCRGLNCSEDLFRPGTFSVDVKEGDVTYIILSTNDSAEADAAHLFDRETERRKALLQDQPADTLVQQLVLAADQFIVKKSDDLKTIIAGYHWFTDWSRDTMISLPGLCLATNRFDDARKILLAFARSVNEGMLPNRFPDAGETLEYNNVDGTLWFFVAAYKYLKATEDKEFVLKELLPVMTDIIDWHYKGTRYNIHVDEDSLLFSGQEGIALTWMDARVGNSPITPRMGKPVEIQALWYNALMIFNELLEMNNQDKRAEIITGEAEKVQESFLKKFWYATGKYLYDVIDENGQPDATLRPNQLFAIGLPFPLLEGNKAKSALKAVEEKLYTPKGLRTLSPDDIKYVRRYVGSQFDRDSCYHQGTVWGWLLGIYADAMMKVSPSAAQKKRVTKVMETLLPHLSEAGIGTVSEIFDAEAPHESRGAIAQAWGVAEVLRVIKEYELVKFPVKKAKAKAKAVKPKTKAAKPKAAKSKEVKAKAAKPESKPKEKEEELDSVNNTNLN